MHKGSIGLCLTRTCWGMHSFDQGISSTSSQSLCKGGQIGGTCQNFTSLLLCLPYWVISTTVLMESVGTTFPMRWRTWLVDLYASKWNEYLDSE